MLIIVMPCRNVVYLGLMADFLSETQQPTQDEMPAITSPAANLIQIYIGPVKSVD
jgi:hypothetical protein